MNKAEIKSLISRYEGLEAKSRVWWKTHWMEISRYVLANYDDIYSTQVPGEKKSNNSKIFDTTAYQSLKLLAAGLHSMLTNPSIPFFGLTTGIEELDSDEEVRDWLQKASNSMHAVLNGSNFQTEIHETYIGLAGFGTSVTFMDEDKKDKFRCHTKPIYYCVIDENHQGIVDTVGHTFKWDVRKIIKKFGIDSLPKQWVESGLNDSKLAEQHTVLHMVYPRSDAKMDSEGNAMPGPKNMPFASIYILKDVEHALSESGFHEFPYLVPRWLKLPGETYGRSPTMDALPDIKMINAMAKVNIEAMQLAVRPPLQREDDGVNQIINYTPGAINLTRAGSKGITPINTGANPKLGEELMLPVKERIKQHFFLNQLQLAENNPQMTATEVLQRTDEKLRIMAPILARQHYELLKPLVDRLFGIMLRNKLLPSKIPAKLSNVNIQVQYSSMIARAQKAVNAETVTRVLGLMGGLMQVKPDILDNLNTDETFLYVSEISGLPQKLLNGRAKTEQMRNGRMEQAKQQDQMQQAQAAAEIAQKTQGIAQ